MKLSFSLPLAFLALAAARIYPLKRLKHPSALHTRAQISQDGQVTTSNAGTPFSLGSVAQALPAFPLLTPTSPSTIDDLIYLVDVSFNMS
jgi:saccharopepsin